MSHTPIEPAHEIIDEGDLDMLVGEEANYADLMESEEAHYLDFPDMRPGQLVANVPMREGQRAFTAFAKAAMGPALHYKLVVDRPKRVKTPVPDLSLLGTAFRRGGAAVTGGVHTALERVSGRVLGEAKEVAAGVHGETDVRMLFEALADYWVSQTRFDSSFMEVAQHPAAELLVKIGRPVVPFIVERLDEDPDRFGYVLARITAAQPVAEGANPEDVAPAWRTWLADHGWS